MMRRYITIEGHETERNPKEYPYSYTRFCIYKNNMWSPTDSCVWSDRLMRQNYELFESMLGPGQYLSSKKPEDIEKYLCAVFKRNVMLTGIEEECNYMTGYPYWILYYANATDDYNYA